MVASNHIVESARQAFVGEQRHTFEVPSRVPRIDPTGFIARDIAPSPQHWTPCFCCFTHVVHSSPHATVDCTEYSRETIPVLYTLWPVNFSFVFVAGGGRSAIPSPSRT